jgi:phosphoserine phosphatase
VRNKNNTKKVVVSDLEGTLTTGSSWKGLRAFYKKHNRSLTYNLFFLRWFPNFILVKLGLLSRKQTMFRWLLEEIKLFEGTTSEEFDQIAEWVVENEMWPKRREDILLELYQYQQSGAKILVVSGDYQPIVDSFARRMGAVPIGSKLAFDGNHLVGLRLPLNGYEQKVESIQAQVGDSDILTAYGDSLSDVPMLEMSQKPVVVNPDSKLKKLALMNGWRIITTLPD